ncbi:hypothetical protein [Mesorhizobium ventifaucium]|uniref:Uncharacterized protein n=1 Tax=Mesorhizobium ventifaucium TaxID=666020 RepID=A0ABN8KA66_9HYPH|nr:hypothetical protein [Mesorhizobium ventifaucium]CAH2407146.1 hypothetical protein MES4922_60118 [Mesorhizobium ventifaucium]
MSAGKERMTFADLEPLICDSDNMVDVLLNLLEEHFSCLPPESGNYVITEAEGSRLFFVASVAESMSHKAKDAYSKRSKEKRLNDRRHVEARCLTVAGFSFSRSGYQNGPLL